jgi:hypothetical protein
MYENDEPPERHHSPKISTAARIEIGRNEIQKSATLPVPRGING